MSSSWRSELLLRLESTEGVEAALYAIAIALENLVSQVKYLGNGDASTTMGAIEALGMHLGEKIEMLGYHITSNTPE